MGLCCRWARSSVGVKVVIQERKGAGAGGSRCWQIPRALLGFYW